MAKTMEKCCLNAFMTGFEFLKSIKFIFLPHYLVYLLFCFTTCMANKVDQKDLYKYLGSTCSRTKHYACHMQLTMRIARRCTALLLPRALPLGQTVGRTQHRSYRRDAMLARVLAMALCLGLSVRQKSMFY